jgi:NTP pyrophosphatase (non-canonical NTP hydrolase)|tara:strand:- start:278 stop:622 length:345 start_codon:yes stop_codon:yes gene_type:complete
MIKQETIDRILKFRNDRDWGQFHTIKDLCLGLNIEVSELQEIFLWKDDKELKKTINTKKESIGDELADIFIFLAYLSNDLNIDLNEAINRKIDKNGNKYPIAESRGSNKKYNEL